MTILYLHGFCARLNGRKAGYLRAHFGEDAVIEPAEPGFPYGRTVTRPVLEMLSHKLKHNPMSLMGLFGPTRMTTLQKLVPDLAKFYTRSVEMAQSLYDQHRPDIIVGSSLGGSIAMGMQSGETPIVLVGPVWNQNVKPGISADSLADIGLLKRLALNAATAALRNPIARFAELAVTQSIKPQTIILHSAHDRVFDISNSHTLIRNSPIATDNPWQETMDRVIESLAAAGYGNRKSSMYADYNDGRLIIIGKDHHTNEPDPRDRHNKDPHPHNALVTAVRALLDVSVTSSAPARL